MPVQRSYSTKTIIFFEIGISAKEILELLPDLLPTDQVEVVFRVPPGDYGGMDLEVVEESPIIVKVTRTRT